VASKRAAQVIAVGLGQMVAWASSTYLPAMLATPMASDHGLAPSWVFAAFSCALGIMALLGPAVGRIIDQQGGRRVLCASNLVLAAGLVVLGVSSGTGILFFGWSLLGAGMALGLYDAAFAALVRQHGLEARAPITGITLLGGFASTLGWPLTAFLVAQSDWRIACFAWAGANLLIALPLNYFFIPALSNGVTENSAEAFADSATAATVNVTEHRRNFILLAIFGAATAFVTSAMAAHLPTFLAAAGVGTAAAIGAAALVGPAQVLARLGEFVAARKYRLDSLSTARVATAMHPLAGLVFLVAACPAAAMVFAALHGAGNGLITIAKGTLTLSLFGPQGYGVLQGKLAIAQRVMQALAPFLFALLMVWGGAAAGLGLTVAMSLVALFALALIRR
jgi:MFS family permease